MKLVLEFPDEAMAELEADARADGLDHPVSVLLEGLIIARLCELEFSPKFDAWLQNRMDELRAQHGVKQ